MKPLFSLALAVATLAIGQAQAPQKPVALFDGRSFAGWEGDIKGTWRIQDGAIVGGSLTAQVPRNEFLTTTRSFGDFVLRVRFKLVGTEGFINGGVQFRSQRLEKPAHEMTGYQADLGDEVLGQPLRRVAPQQDAGGACREADRRDPEAWRLERLRDPRRGPRIRLSINGRQTIDYTETDPAIPREGLIGLQIHGGGKAEAWYKDITIVELK